MTSEARECFSPSNLIPPMEKLECVSFDDDFGEEILDDDVEMDDSELVGDGKFGAGEVDSLSRVGSGYGGSGGCEGAVNGGGGEGMRNGATGGSRRKRNKKKKKRKSGSNTSITDINRFVINTCKRLKEKKSYLVWNAVGCLGASAMMDIVKEVDAIQHCGGQKTADGERFRTGGGVLWNILKTREPKAYKEIMAKGKEFEKQFRQPQNKQSSGKDVIASPVQKVPHNASESPVSVSSENLPSSHNHQTSKPQERQSSVRDRIRVPVCYDNDLLEEGEIYEP